MKQDYTQIRMFEVDTQVYAAGQLFGSDLQLLAAQGTRGIINTRPDNESEGQPKSADLAKAAEEYGITLVHLPIDPASITEEAAVAFARAAETLGRPLIVCSRSGALSAKIWEKVPSA